MGGGMSKLWALEMAAKRKGLEVRVMRHGWRTLLEPRSPGGKAVRVGGAASRPPWPGPFGGRRGGPSSIPLPHGPWAGFTLSIQTGLLGKKRGRGGAIILCFCDQGDPRAPPHLLFPLNRLGQAHAVGGFRSHPAEKGKPVETPQGFLGIQAFAPEFYSDLPCETREKCLPRLNPVEPQLVKTREFCV